MSGRNMSIAVVGKMACVDWGCCNSCNSSSNVETSDSNPGG